MIRFHVVLIAMLAACGKGGTDHKADRQVVEQGSAASSGKPADVTLFGEKPIPPGDLAKVKIGMTKAQVAALFPGAKLTDSKTGNSFFKLDSGYKDVEYYVYFYDGKDAVVELMVVAPIGVAAKLDQAWGKPTTDMPSATWVDAVDGYDVTRADLSKESQVTYHAHAAQ